MPVFVGRDQELELLDREVRPGQMIALVGPSGVGKTALATAWSDRRDDVLMVDCRERLPIDAANEIAASETLHDETDAWLLAASRLSNERVAVLILDDVSEDFGDLRTLRNNWDGCIITTSHKPLPGGDVATMAIGGFDLPSRGAPTEADAYELFVQTARTVDVRFSIDSQEELDAFVELVDRFDGYPLALAIAARRAATLSVREVLRLVDEQAVLTQQTSTDRHRSMQAALGVSIDPIGSSDLELLYAMSMFRRPVRTTILAKLLDAPVDDILEALERLVRAGLVSASAFPRPLELVADYVRTHARSRLSGSVDTIEARALDAAFASAVDTVSRGAHDDHFGEGPSFWIWVVTRPDAPELPREELAHVLAAVQLWLQLLAVVPEAISHRVEELLRVVDHHVSWLEFGRTHSDLAEALRALEHAFDASESDEQRFTSRLNMASKLVVAHQFEEASRRHSEALEFAEHTVESRILAAEIAKYGPGDESPEATRLALAAINEELAEVESHRRRESLLRAASVLASDSESVSYARRCIEEARLCGSPRTLAKAQLTYADVALSAPSGDLDREVLREAFGIFVGVGDFMRAAIAVSLEALFMVVDGHLEEAVERIEEAVESTRGGREKFEKMQLFVACEALVRSIAGQHEQALSVVDRVEALSHEFGIRMARLAKTLTAAERRENVDEIVSSACSEDPSHRAIYQAAYRISTATSKEIDEDVLKALEGIQLALDSDIYPFYPALLTSWAQRASGPGFQQVLLLDEVDAELVIAPGASAIRVEESWTTLVGNSTSQALLLALVNADRPLDFEAIGASIYPDETLTYEALQNRVNVAVSRLRKLGLKKFVIKQPEGFVLEGDIYAA